MPLKPGYSDRTIRHNIRRGIRRGFRPSVAIARAHQCARLCAMSKGNMQRFGALVGAELPVDIAAMNEDQALAELTRIDNLAATRKLSATEFKRLTDLELRLEQFADDKELARAADIERRARKGEDVFGPPVVIPPGTLITTIDPGPIAARGTRNPWPLIIGGMLLALNFLI